MKEFALVTVSYNSGEDIQRLSESLHRQNYDRGLFDWIIVDNCGHNKDDRERVKQLCEEEKYVYLQSDKNGGFAYGSNFGIEYALQNKYKYICLINPDCVFTQNDFFTNLEQSFRSGKDIISPLITYYPDVDVIYSAGGSISKLVMLTRMHGKGDRDFSKYKTEKRCDFATGCALFSKREVFEKIGLIPEEYFLYFEESDWCFNAVKSGFNMYYIPSVQIAHGVSTSIGYLSKIYIFYMIRNYRIFALKYIAWYYILIFYIFYIFFWCAGYCFLLIKNGKPRLIRYIFKGFFNVNL